MLGAKEIKEILPHRYPFLMIDRVEEVEEGKRAKGFKNISINEEFFNGHFPDYPVMPGVLILEALAQMGAICILSKEEFKGKIGFLVGADKVRWKQQVIHLIYAFVSTFFGHARNNINKIAKLPSTKAISMQ